MHSSRLTTNTFRVLMLLAMAWILLASKGVSADTQSRPSMMTIQTMAKMESDALAQIRWQSERARQPTQLKPQLLAIHGVLPDLQASLLVDGSPVIFRQGQVKPVQDQSTRGQLRLRHIKPPCVSYVDRGRPQRLCLPKDQL